MSQLTDEQVQECAKLHALFIARREDQNARNEKPISQESIAHVLGVNQSRVSQIMSTRKDSSPISPENALVFARLLDCTVDKFSPRIAALLSGTPVYQVPIVEGTSQQIVKVARQMCRGETPAVGAARNFISYPGQCAVEVRGFEIDSQAMEPMLSQGSYAYVDPTIEVSSGNAVCLVRDDKVVFATYIGEETYEYENKKFSDAVFKLKGKDCVVGVVIGCFKEFVTT